MGEKLAEELTKKCFDNLFFFEKFYGFSAISTVSNTFTKKKLIVTGKNSGIHIFVR